MLGTFLVLYLLVAMSPREEPLVEVLRATRQEITGGRNETGVKHHYAIQVKALRGSRQLRFEKIWTGDRAGVPSIWDAERSVKIDRFSRGDTLFLVLTIMQERDTPEKVLGASIREKIPKYEGDGLIEMIFRKKTRYQEIDTFEVLEPIYSR